MKFKFQSVKIQSGSLAFAMAIVAGCDNMKEPSASPAGSNSTMSLDGTNAMNRDVDNSGINSRDRNGNTLTPGDQGNTPEDRDLTQKIRKALVGDTSYSTAAKNVKIITLNGRVTLRGPVNSEAEKNGVAALAKKLAGDGNVNDQLEVKSSP